MAGDGKGKLDMSSALSGNTNLSRLIGATKKENPVGTTSEMQDSKNNSIKRQPRRNERKTYSAGFKAFEFEKEDFENIRIAFGLATTGDALRWCYETIWSQFGDEITRIAEEKKKIQESLEVNLSFAEKE